MRNFPARIALPSSCGDGPSSCHVCLRSSWTLSAFLPVNGIWVTTNASKCSIIDGNLPNQTGHHGAAGGRVIEKNAVMTEIGDQLNDIRHEEMANDLLALGSRRRIFEAVFGFLGNDFADRRFYPDSAARFSMGKGDMDRIAGVVELREIVARPYALAQGVENSRPFAFGIARQSAGGSPGRRCRQRSAPNTPAPDSS